jgi:citrate lyase subunit gamma (acyl carrier protein)
MNNEIIKKASCGKEDKSDCFITIVPKDSLQIEIHSKVQELFGKAIEKTVREVLRDNNIEKGYILVKDFGALDWVIRARLECALQRASV